MSEITVEIKGLDKLEQALRNEMKNVAKKTLRGAGKRATKIWVEAIESEAPHLSGFLEENIVQGSISEGGTLLSDGSMTVEVGPSKEAFYGLFDEFGTSKQAPNPFMRRAFEAHQDDVLAAFVDELWNALQDLEEK